MQLAPDAAEVRVLASLDAALFRADVMAAIEEIVSRVDAIMARDAAAIEAWEPIPLSIYGGALAPDVRSSWVFILRRAVTTGAERHPNSRQRMTSWRGGGDFQVHDGREWISHRMESGRKAPIEKRWISIPPSTWHQGVVGEQDWAVVSFHTVPAADLVEERPEPGDPSLVRARRYVAVPQAGRLAPRQD